MNFSLMYVYVLLFYKICLLTYFHVKIYVHVPVLSLQRKTSLKPCLLIKKRNQTYLLINKGPYRLFVKLLLKTFMN